MTQSELIMPQLRARNDSFLNHMLLFLTHKNLKTWSFTQKYKTKLVIVSYNQESNSNYTLIISSFLKEQLKPI